MKSKRYRNLILVVVMLNLSACSYKIIYNNLDWLTYWYIDDYISLTSQQEQQLEPALIQFLAWHREYEIPSYIALIKQLQLEINSDVTKTDIEQYIRSFKDIWQTILTRIEPSIVQLAYTFKDKQVEQFLNVLEQRNLDQLEEYRSLTSNKRLQKRLDKIESRIESYIGNLTANQKQLIKNSNQQMLPTFEEWISYRRAWANSIKQAFTLREEKDNFEIAMRRAILEADSLRSETFLKKIEHNQNLWTSTLATLINTLNDKQLKRLNSKLEDMADDLQALL